MEEPGWIEVCTVSELGDKTTHVVDLAGEPVVLRRVGAGWQAFSMTCPHKGGAMREVDVRGDQLACPLHAWIFDLADGGREIHDNGDLMEFHVRADEQRVLIRP